MTTASKQCRDEVEEEWKQQGKVPESDSNDLLIFKEGRPKPQEKFKVKLAVNHEK